METPTGAQNAPQTGFYLQADNLPAHRLKSGSRRLQRAGKPIKGSLSGKAETEEKSGARFALVPQNSDFEHMALVGDAPQTRQADRQKMRNVYTFAQLAKERINKHNAQEVQEPLTGAIMRAIMKMKRKRKRT